MLSKILSVSEYPDYLRLLWWRFVLPAWVRKKGVYADSQVVYYGAPIITLSSGSRIEIGARTVLCSHSNYTALGVCHPVVLRTLRPDAAIRIGADVGISGATICAAKSIEIGAETLLGANVTIVDTDFHALDAINRRYNNDPANIAVAPVVIGRNVFIGTGAIVLKGASIGANSVIGAGSVVVGPIPDNVIAAGNPARVVRHL